jgi:spermidine/putrescine transport system substrate-binding protein
MKKLRIMILVSLLLVSVSGSTCIRNQPNGLRRELHVYNWSNYVGSKTIADFERRYSVRVIYDNYSSNDELYSKLKAGGAGYDVIVPTDYMVNTMIKENLLEPIDQSKLPNLKNLSKRFVDLPFDPGNKYSIPYFWGTTGIGVNADKVADSVADWGILFDEKYKGKISVLDDMRYTIGMALRYLGYSANTINPDELQKAKQLLIRQKPFVRAYSSDTYMDLLTSGDVWLSYGFSGDVYQTRRQNKSIRYFIPKEGTMIGVDNLCIPKGAKNADLAHVFINFILEPQVAADIANEILYPSPNEASYQYTDKAILNDPSIYPSPEVMNKCEFLRNLGDATQLYEKIWTEVKTK